MVIGQRGQTELGEADAVEHRVGPDGVCRNLELVGADRLEEAREAAAELRPEVEDDEEAES